VGAIATAAMAAAGGTSGISIDNIVGPGDAGGGFSNIFFHSERPDLCYLGGHRRMRGAGVAIGIAVEEGRDH
jgi:hypothetical protein